MNSYDITLPKWLDDVLFIDENAVFCNGRDVFSSNKWGREELRAYLGTYFPRSYAEGRHIADRYIAYCNENLQGKSRISILDYCCGTGGQLFGFLDAIVARLPNVREVLLCYIDVNVEAHLMFYRILYEWMSRNGVHVIVKSFLVETKTVQNLVGLKNWSEKIQEKYDLILTFKGLCEFLKEGVFNGDNPYGLFLRTFSTLLDEEGVLIFADVLVQPDRERSEKWTSDWLVEGITENKKWNWLLARKQDFEDRIRVCHSHSGAKGDSETIDWYMIKGGKTIPDAKDVFVRKM